MLQQQSHLVISSKIDLPVKPLPLGDLQVNHPGVELYSPLINEVNPENLKVLKDGGTAFVLSLCLLIIVLKDFVKELHQD